MGQKGSPRILVGKGNPVCMHEAVFVAQMPGNEIEKGIDDVALQPKHAFGKSVGMVDTFQHCVLVKERGETMERRNHAG